MPKKTTSIPLNTMANRFGAGIAIGKASIKNLRTFKEAEQSHRDDYHIFFLQEQGTLPIEIDFQKYLITPSTVAYIYPNQVHRMTAFENVTLSFWAISNENLNPEYLKLLKDIAPLRPLLLDEQTFTVISKAVSLSIELSERSHEKLFNSLFKDSCNTLVGLVISQYLAQGGAKDTLSRFEVVANAFRSALEIGFGTCKKPSAYAAKLNISLPYLNECVKNATGQPVSYHIQQRVILEIKRLLYHSNLSVKQIASNLGYDDYTYFSKFFKKLTGTTPLGFRAKNLD